MTATNSVKRADLTAVDGGFAVKLSAGPNTGRYLSVQIDGSLQYRDVVGPWETGNVQDDKWVVFDPNYPTGAYALLIVG